MVVRAREVPTVAASGPPAAKRHEPTGPSVSGRLQPTGFKDLAGRFCRVAPWARGVQDGDGWYVAVSRV